MGFFLSRIALFFTAIFLWVFPVSSQSKSDSLLDELSKVKDKSRIYNLLAELHLQDSLELSESFASKALHFAIHENDLQQKGLAYFNIAEVCSNQYQLDSAKYYYQEALEIFKEVNDDYNSSYALNNLGWISNRYGEFNEAIEYYIQSIRYLDKDLNADDLSHVYVNIGNAYYQLGKYETSIKYYHQSVSIARSINYEPILTYAYNGIGLSNKYLSNFDSAIYYYTAALDIDQNNKDSMGLAIDFHNIGSLYFEWKQYDQALDYFVTAKDIYLEYGSKNDLSLILNNIGNAYREKGNYDLAFEHIAEALAIDSTTGIEHNIAARLNSIGELYAEQYLNHKSLEYFNKSLQLNKKLGRKQNIAVNLHNIGEVCINLKAYKKAQMYFEQGLLIADSLNASSTIIEFLASLTKLNKLTGNYEQALNYHIRYANLKDSTFKEKNQLALADMKTKYELNKKDQEITLLSSKAQIHDIEVNSYKTRMLFLLIGLIIISLLSFFLILQYLNKNKAYKKLVERNKEYLDHERQIKAIMAEPLNNTLLKDNKENRTAETEHYRLMQKLLNYFENEKPYLNHEITIKEVADHLNTNPKYISQGINHNFNKNFNTFVNEYRIRLAMKYLANGVKEQYSIEGISYKVGFHSKSAFNVAFKKMTGVTPSFYIKSLKKETSEIQ
jgi:tetratricopeptide (TPR) repeat protein